MADVYLLRGPSSGKYMVRRNVSECVAKKSNGVIIFITGGSIYQWREDGWGASENIDRQIKESELFTDIMSPSKNKDDFIRVIITPWGSAKAVSML